MGFNIDRRALLAGIACAATAPQLAHAAWPERTITLVHGFAPGGNADVVARIVAEALTRKLDAQFIVEPKPGAGGTLAAAYVARAKPDGQILAVLPGGHPVSAAIYKQLPYRTVEDFTWITEITDYPFILATYNEHPVKHINQLVDYARSASKPLLCANVGNGSGQHLSGELLAAMAKIRIDQVPYKGGPEGMLDVIAQRIDLIVDTPTVLLERVRAGQLRALAVTSASRFFALPDTPTVAEGGIAGYDTNSWLGLAAPAGLSPEIVARLNAVMREILGDETIASRLRALGSNPSPSSGEALRDKVAAEVVKWTKVVTDAHIERL